MGKSYPAMSEEYKAAIDKTKRKIRGFIAKKNCASLILHLVWNSAGTYVVKTKTQGPFGTMRHKGKQGYDANNGLDIAVRLLEPIKEQFTLLSYSDFYQGRPMLNEAIESEIFEDVVDPRLGKSYKETEMFRIMKVAAACIRHSSSRRPRMSQDHQFRTR